MSTTAGQLRSELAVAGLIGRIWNRLRIFIFPLADAPLWVRLAPYAVLTGLFLMIAVTGVYAWDYSNSPEFCGMTCHTMPPEYASYQASPHARVKCVECHIGREFVGNQFTRKIGDVRHVTAMAFTAYEYPIVVRSMRPARETCERCHFPEKFSDDSQRVIVHYAPNEQNTQYRTYLLLKTGGGTAREGLGRGIHWHIENKVLFYAADDREQEIPYVKVFDAEGMATEYVDITVDFDTYRVDESELKEMDCMTCHNRISHTIYQPEEAVDRALNRQLISADIPEIKLKAVEALRAPYESTDHAIRGIAGLADYYRDAYPDYYDANGEVIEQAIDSLQEIYIQSVFPEQKVDWDTHADNLGHQTAPGCFRCHDGKHLDGSGFAIRLECNLCHAIPTIAAPDDLVTQIEINHERQQGTHRNPNWIALHRVVFDENDENETCSSCHDISNYDQANDTSFCSNSACHGRTWTYLDLDVLDTERVREIMLRQLPHYPASLQPIAAWEDPPSLDSIHRGQEGMVCEDCHDPFPPEGTPANAICIECHGETVRGVEELTAYLDPNPHDWHYGDELSCSFCHRNFGPYQSSCALCHEDVPVVPIEDAGQ